MKRTASICLAISLIALWPAAPAWARLRPRYGGTLRVETRAQAADSAMLAALTTETLTRLDDRGTVKPLLADRWESSNAGRRWTLAIHPHIAMHDGTPLTGTVVAEILSAGHAVAPWQTVHGTDTEVIFDSDAPVADLPVQLASPEFVISRRTADGLPLGTGPFRVTSITGANATLEANDAYWRGRAFVDRIEIYGGRTVKTQWMDLGVDRADVAEVPGESLRRAQQDHLRVQSYTPAEIVMIVVSTEIKDQRLRQAISAAIDRSSLANVVFQKQGQPATTLLPDSMTGYSVLFGSGYDAANARSLRAQADVPAHLTISYDPSEPALQLAAERIALNAREAGIPLQAAPQSANASAQLKLARVKLLSSDPAAALESLSRTLLAQTIIVAPGTDALYAAETQLLSGAQLIPLVHLPQGVAVAERVRDLVVHWSGADLNDAWIEERR